MTQFIFATESYPFSANLAELLSDPDDHAVLLTHDVHLTLTPAQLACFRQVVPVEHFDLESLERALTTRIELQPGAAIVSHDDFFYELFAELGRRHGLRIYTLDSISPFVNKNIMKQRLRGSGIRVPSYQLFDRVAFDADPSGYIEHVIRGVGLPVFAKPLQGAGAENTALLGSAEQLREWCAAKNPGGPFELDEYIGDAVLYHCDSVIQFGRVVFTQPSCYSRPCADFVQGAMVGSYTLSATSPQHDELCEFACDVIDAFARHAPVPDGVTHMEMFRKRNEWIFLEVQFRPPGANVKLAYAQHLGVNLEDLHFQLQMAKPIPALTAGGPYAAWLYFPTRDGVVERRSGLPDLCSEVVEATYGVEAGQRTQRPRSILDARGRGVVALSLVIRNNDYSALVADFERLSRHQPFVLAKARNAD